MRLFSFRNGETFSVSPGVVLDGARYIVMLTAVPPMPEPRSDVAANLCVIAAEFTDSQWQWMQMCPDTKEEVGAFLEKHKAPVGVWSEMVVIPVEPRDQSRLIDEDVSRG